VDMTAPKSACFAPPAAHFVYYFLHFAVQLAMFKTSKALPIRTVDAW